MVSTLLTSVHALKHLEEHTDDGLIRARKAYMAVRSTSGDRINHIILVHKRDMRVIWASSPGDRTLIAKLSSASPMRKNSKDKMDHAA